LKRDGLNLFIALVMCKYRKIYTFLIVNFEPVHCNLVRARYNTRREQKFRLEKMSMREKLIRFMQGRYGTDQFSRFLLGVALVMVVLSLFIRSGIWSILVFALIIYCYFRMFSRNIPKRYAENQKYLQMTAVFRRKWATFRRDMRERKTHHIYKCPGCGQKIRVPRGRGKIAIRCPKCNREFIRRS